MKAMILAAGQGTRLRPYTLKLPKPAIPFLGLPLAEYALSLLEELPVQEIVANHHHLSSEVIRTFQRPSFQKYKIHFSDETHQLLGSGGGVHFAQPSLEGIESFVVLNGDELIFPHFSGQIAKAHFEHVLSNRLATLVVKEDSRVGTQFGGAWCDETLRVSCFSKTPVENLKGWHYLGVIFLHPRVFQFFKPQLVEENLLYETLTAGMKAGETVCVRPIEAEWFESGNPQDFVEATDHCLDQLLSTPLPNWAEFVVGLLKKHTLLTPMIESEPLMLKKWEEVRKKFGLRSE